MNVELPSDWVLTHALAGVRITAVVFTAPLFSHRAIPRKYRLALAVAFTMSLIGDPRLAMDGGWDSPSLVVAGWLVREAVIGSAIGIAAGFAFAGFGMMAEFIAIQGGLGAANAIDPTSGISTVVLTSLIQVIGLFLFLAVDGHHQVLAVVVSSFAALPIGTAWRDLHGVFAGVVALGHIIFEVAVSLAAPVVVAMLASNVAVGILGRTIPQLNLIALQLPAHIAVTLLLLGLGAGPLTEQMTAALTTVVADIGSLVSE